MARLAGVWGDSQGKAKQQDCASIRDLSFERKRKSKAVKATEVSDFWLKVGSSTVRADNPANWLIDISSADIVSGVDGLVLVKGFRDLGLPPEQYMMMEKAEGYEAHSVFFEAGRNDRPAVARAFIYVSDQAGDDQAFAELHKRLWSWGGVPFACIAKRRAKLTCSGAPASLTSIRKVKHPNIKHLIR